MFIKGLGELHTRQEPKVARTAKPIEVPVFAARQDALRWSRFKELAPEQMLDPKVDSRRREHRWLHRATAGEHRRAGEIAYPRLTRTQRGEQ